MNMPKSEREKILEIGLLKLTKACIENNMPIDEILAVLERVRHTVTEIKLEIEANEDQN